MLFPNFGSVAVLGCADMRQIVAPPQGGMRKVLRSLAEVSSDETQRATGANHGDDAIDSATWTAAQET